MMRGRLILRAIDIINRFITLYLYNDGRETQTEDGRNGVKSTLKAIEFVFLTFDDNILQSLPKTKYTQMLRFVLRTKPILLQLMVDRLKPFFYQADNDTEFTYFILSNLTFLSKTQLRKALPVIFRLFVNPSSNNPTGLFNKSFSRYTRDFLRDNVSSWYELLESSV